MFRYAVVNLRKKLCVTGIGENTLAQPVKPPLRERRACLAKLVKNRLTLTRPPTRLDAVLRDMGGVGDRVLRQTVHRPQPQDLPGPEASRHVEPPRSLDCMAARA